MHPRLYPDKALHVCVLSETKNVSTEDAQVDFYVKSFNLKRIFAQLSQLLI